jgi:hypothetical protein
MMADLIHEKDSLNTGRVKLNNAIQQAEDAKNVANDAKTVAEDAKSTATNVQEQFNQVVIEGDSSVEAAQARVDKDGHTYTTLKERLDTEHEQVVSQLAQTEQGIINLQNTKVGKSYLPFSSVIDSGAVGDGLTDDTDAFKDASIKYDISIPDGLYVLNEDIIGDFNISRNAHFLNKKAIDIQSFVKECINFLSERLRDNYNHYYLTGNRRKVEVRKPNDTYTYDTEIVPDTGINATSSALTLELLSKYIKRYPSERSNILPILEEVARNLMSLQWKDERTTRYGGFKTADNLSTARAFTTGKAILGLLEAYEVTNNPIYLASCERAAVFLGVLADPNPIYQAKYGVTPIPEVTLNADFAGFCDQIQADDTINVTSTTWNLVASKALFKLWQITGNQTYKDLCDQTRDYHAYGVINGYDYFAIRNTNPPSKVSNAWPNNSSGISGDGAWHRFGDYVDTGTVGTDQIEYGLDALWATGYDIQTLKDVYEFYCSLEHADPGSSFGANYDSEICWTGYFRINSPEYNGESRAYGSYYDSQGAGTTLAFKKALFPEHYKKTTGLLAVLPYSGALLDENYNTIYSDGNGYKFATKGVIPIACAAIGLLDGLEVHQ